LDYLTTYTSLSPNTAWVRARLCKLQKGCTRLAVASDKVYQLLTHGRWFSPGTPASSTTKTGRHDIAEILLKVALNTIKIKSNHLHIDDKISLLIRYLRACGSYQDFLDRGLLLTSKLLNQGFPIG
jgi:hypothetical protein